MPLKLGGYFPGRPDRRASKGTLSNDAPADAAVMGAPGEQDGDQHAGISQSRVALPGMPMKPEPQVEEPLSEKPPVAKKAPSYLPPSLPAYHPPPKAEKPFSLTMPSDKVEQAEAHARSMQRFRCFRCSCAPFRARHLMAPLFMAHHLVLRVRIILGFIVGGVLFLATSVVFLLLVLQLVWVIPLIMLLRCLTGYERSSSTSLPLQSSHVAILGGSTGLSRELVLACVRQGADVTLLAPDSSELRDIYEEMRTAAEERLKHLDKSVDKRQHIRCTPLDTTTGPIACFTALQNLVETAAPIDSLICLPLEVVQAFVSASDSCSEEDDAWNDELELDKSMLMCCVWGVRGVAIKMKRNMSGRVLLVGDSADAILENGEVQHQLSIHSLAQSIRKELDGTRVVVSVAASVWEWEQPGREADMQEGCFPIERRAKKWDLSNYAQHLVDHMMRGEEYVYAQLGGRSDSLSYLLNAHGYAPSPFPWAIVNAYMLPLLWLTEMPLAMEWQVYLSRCRNCGTAFFRACKKKLYRLASFCRSVSLCRSASLCRSPAMV
ncbi:hypothetical protein AB1Y20_013129 [Prymnesium parvum]|uniref:Ketoreductase (KR) domain-containing protein n=1 Tax=Prymnesium parvum TaxID=97485 RepID=A0AB34IMG0_PRYPA